MKNKSWDDISEEDIFRLYARTGNPELKDAIIERFMPLVGPVIRKFQFLGESYEDLAQVGYVGLVKALELFDPERNVKFSTYATHCIMGEVRHYMRDKAETIRKPRWMKKLSAPVAEYINDYLQKEKRFPTVKELSEELDIGEEEATELLKFKRMVSLDEDIFTTSGDSVDRVSGLKSETYRPEPELEERIVLEQAMEELKQKEKTIIYFFFYMDLTQIQIAEKIGISQKKVSRMLKKAIGKLRDILTKDIW